MITLLLEYIRLLCDLCEKYWADVIKDILFRSLFLEYTKLLSVVCVKSPLNSE